MSGNSHDGQDTMPPRTPRPSPCAVHSEWELVLVASGQRVGYFSLPYPRPCGQRVGMQFPRRHDVADDDPLHQQEVADQSPMTPPEQALGTHQCRPLAPGRLQQLLDSVPELLGAHVVGIVAEALIAKAEV